MTPKKEISPTKNEDLVKTVKELVETFKVDKLLYNISTVISFMLLLTCALFLLFNDTCQNTNEVIGMCGSTGVIAFTCSRILKMWDDAIKFVDQHYKE